MNKIDVLSKIYVKFYICQIQASISYPIWYKVETEKCNMWIDDDEDEEIKIMEELAKSMDNSSQAQSASKQVITKPQVEEKYLRKMFVYKSKLFSKVEVMGIVVSVKSINDTRLLIHVDDCTGVIECIWWKNKNEEHFSKIQKETKHGTFLRILGHVDFYTNKFEIQIERLNFIKSFEAEYWFHWTAQQNMKAIQEIHIEEDIKKELNDYTNITTVNNIRNSSNKKCNSDKPNRRNDAFLKDFVNKCLAFFEGFKIEGETVDEYGFVRLSVREFIANTEANRMWNDSFGFNSDAKLTHLREAFELILEPNLLGKVIYKDEKRDFITADLEIKNNNNLKLKTDIYNFIKDRNEENPNVGIGIKDILQFINNEYKGLFTKEYISGIISMWIDSMEIYNFSNNSYAVTQNY